MPQGEVSLPLQEEHRGLLSTALAGRRDVWIALSAALISAAFFLAAAPFAKMPLPQVPAFIPIYAAALVTCDLVTAILLFGQYSFLRSRALLALASGYVLTAALAALQTLVFPGVFSPTGLLHAGPQFAAWTYIFWHAAFPIIVIAYARREGASARRDATAGRSRDSALAAILVSVTAVLAIVCGFVVVVGAGYVSLPVVIEDNRITAAGRIAISSGWVLSALALVVLWTRRQRTVLDLWLMVVMCAWLFDVALAAILNNGRYDLGWYVGRIYGLLAASFVLGVLLVENSLHFASLIQFAEKLSAANDSLARLSVQDGLTGLANRRRFDAFLAEQVALARRNKLPLALVLIDIDTFKDYNDRYGHLAGDECLKRVASALQSKCRRPADLAARYGGEELALVLPDTDVHGAALIAEAVREAVLKLAIPREQSSIAPCVTVSGGGAVLRGDAGAGENALIAAADANLYKAKRLGRNRIVCT